MTEMNSTISEKTVLIKSRLKNKREQALNLWKKDLL